MQAVPGAILLGALFFFPESPRWLASKEKWDECLDVLARIHGKGDHNTEVVQVEFEEVREAARIAAEAKNVSIFALFGPKMWYRTMCGMSVQMWQQLLGGNVAMYYVVYVFEMAGMVSLLSLGICYDETNTKQSGNTTLYSSAIQYVIFLVTTGSILPFVDRLGRRPLLLSGAVICMALHFTIAGIMASLGHHVDQVDGNTNLRWEIGGAPGKAVISCSYIFVAVYGFTWVSSHEVPCSGAFLTLRSQAPTAWIYCSEVFPLKYRAMGVGVSSATNWIFNFALAYFVAPAFTNIQVSPP